jgi:energy-coupling factor transporter ATP-binding protein EcfA2
MSQPRFVHTAFALTIASEIPLIDLPAGAGHADVAVRIATLVQPRPDAGTWTVSAAPDEAHGWAEGAGAFRVRGGNEIVIDPMSGADERALRLAIVGPLLGVILSQRGRFVLHASSVAIDGAAVAFAGPSGRGKSTLVAALADAGHPLIADDITVIDQDGTAPFVQPGFPRVKLWPDSASALSHDIEALPLLHPDREKRSLLLETFHSTALPLVRCYLLEDGDAEQVSEIAGSAAVLSLVRLTYQASWMHESGVSGANLLHCGALARSGVVRRLHRRRSFSALPEVIRFIEADVRATAHPASHRSPES